MSIHKIQITRYSFSQGWDFLALCASRVNSSFLQISFVKKWTFVLPEDPNLDDNLCIHSQIWLNGLMLS